jgi:16S rRNA U1498 N3-methylase RsmE
MKEIPSLWDETLFIDGYPGKYVILARRSGERWYVAAINAEKEIKKVNVRLPMFTAKKVNIYSDNTERSPELKQMNIKKEGEITLQIQPEGGVIITNCEDCRN